MTLKPLKLMGKKRGMVQLFDEKGRAVPCTVIEVEANVVTQVKVEATDGYAAVQSGFEKVTAKDSRREEARVSKPLRGHFAKGKITPRKYLTETRLENVEEFEVGQEFGVDIFTECRFVDVSAVSIGKGYQGVIKKYGFSGGPGAHGSKFHRHAGSTGMRSTPGRCLPGGPRPSQMGNKKVTMQNLKVFSVDAEKGLLILQGVVPGSKGSLVTITKAVKKNHK
jgi:large subunit ribosomal protein L3